MKPEILRERDDQIMVAEAGSGEAGGAAATPGRSEPCFACRTSRFAFFETSIFLPNKISCKDNMPLLKCNASAAPVGSGTGILFCIKK
jgi:hypothetical protein